MKNRVSILVVLILLFACSTTAYATQYTSSLYMPINSTLAGATRSYVGGTHKITGTLSSVVSWDFKKSQSNVYLNKYVRWGDDIQYGSGTLSFINIGDSSSVVSYGVPNGDFYYFFSTKGLATNAFTCDTVTLTSN